MNHNQALIRAYNQEGILREPVTARDWDDYVTRFPGSPIPWPLADVRSYDCPFMAVGMANDQGDTGEMLVSWCDIWVFYSVMRGMRIQEALAGPNGSIRLNPQQLWERRVRFGFDGV